MAYGHRSLYGRHSGRCHSATATWEGDGFLLLYKRLESGSFQWPRSADEVQALTPQQYRWLMEGLKTEQPKATKKVSGLSVI
jgi:transposase